MIYSPEMYQQDLDKRAYNALAKFPLLVKFKEAYMANVDEKETQFKMMTTEQELYRRKLSEITQKNEEVVKELSNKIKS